MTCRRLAACLCVCAALVSQRALAKDFGLRSPGRRHIYQADERFDEVMDQNRRTFVIEAVVGMAPEGNIGLALGWLPKATKGFELYLGWGLQTNPSMQYVAAMRYLMHFAGYRPYLGLGYMHQSLFAIGTKSHNATVETGYSWILHHTYHLTIGFGIRALLHVQVARDSPLRSPGADTPLLADAIDRLDRWVPTLALRFSRAF